MKQTKSRWISLLLAVMMLAASAAIMTSAVGTTMAQPTFTITHAGTGISAIIPQGVLPEGTTLVAEVGGGAGHVVIIGYWSISFIHNGEEVEPENGAVTIRIPIPEQFANLQIMGLSVLGSVSTPQPSNARIENGYILFNTTVANEFSITASSAETTTATTATTETTATTGDTTETTATTETTDDTTATTATTETTDNTATGKDDETTENTTDETEDETTTAGLTGGKPPPPPQTGFSLSTSATIAAVVLGLGGVYFGWRYYKQKDEE